MNSRFFAAVMLSSALLVSAGYAKQQPHKRHFRPRPRITTPLKHVPRHSHLALHRAQTLAMEADRSLDGRSDHLNDPQAAYHGYLQAARLGSAYAQYMVGICYQHGYGVAISPEKAAFWFRRANRNAQHGQAQRQVAAHYLTPNIPLYNPSEAIRWYQRAALSRDINAMNTLGRLRLFGYDTIPPVPSQAMQWLGRAASLGSNEATYLIGSSFYSGLGVQQDQHQALKWFMKAARRGYVPAQWQVARLYRAGHGVQQDRNKAYAWFLVVASHDSSFPAEVAAHEVAEQLSPTQLIRATHLAQRYVKRYHHA